MKLSKAFTPISELKAHASEIIGGLAKNRETLIITQNGEAKAVLQDLRSFEELQESLALLKMLAQSQQSLGSGKTIPAKDVFRELRKTFDKKS